MPKIVLQLFAELRVWAFLFFFPYFSTRMVILSSILVRLPWKYAHLSAMKMQRALPSSFLLMRSKLPCWENISLCVQNDECDSYRYPTDLEIWEDGLGCIMEGWKYRYFSYRIYFLYTRYSNIHHHENAEYWWNKAHIENTGISSPQ